MATKKAIYQYDNGTGWDEIMFKTTADQVVESSSKRFVSDTEKSTWNGKANASHTHNYAGSSSAGGAATTALACSGNSATATTLATARTINGTSFNGSTNITTSNWGTARTITIGSTGKSINGSANVSWTLSEIGAAPTSHTHSYLPLSGGTLTGEIQMGNKVIKLTTENSSYARLGYDSSTQDVYISNINNNWFRIKADKTITIGGSKVYSAIDKPTPSEIGAAPTSHTHNYLPLSGGTLTGALKFGKAMISDSTQDNTLIINGIQSSSTGAIKLGSGGCRIYGIGDTAKLYVEGGIYTNGDVDAGGGNVKNVTNIWGKGSEVIIEPKRGTGFTGGASFNWTGATTVGSPRYQLTPTDTTDFRVGSPERPIHGVHGKNSYVTTSDRRAKENIVYIEHETRLLSGEQRSNLKEVLTKEDFYNFFKDEIKFTSYDMIGGNIENLETNIGFIAQEIADTKVGSKIVIPPREKIEYHNEDGSVDVEKVENGMYAFSTGNFASATAIALQNSIEKIESLTELVNNLINEINILKNK